MLDHPCDCAMFRVGVMASTASALRAMIAAIAAEMEANRDELCRLDGVIGDADHGIAMALGFGAARDAVGGAGAGGRSRPRC